MLYETLADLRERAGLSLSELQSQTTYDRAYLHKLETGVRLGSPEVMAALDRVYATGNRLQQLWELARNVAFGDRYQRFMELEREATVQYMYASAMVPGLLQTEGYAGQILAEEHLQADELAEQIANRMSRQDILEGEEPPYFRAILDEAVFRRIAADPTVWKDQLATLLEAAPRPNITIQVIPFSAGLHDLMGGSLTILWRADGRAVAYMEGSKSGELIEEPEMVEALRLSYDRLRDKALSPERSAVFIRNLMEDPGHAIPPTHTD